MNRNVLFYGVAATVAAMLMLQADLHGQELSKEYEKCMAATDTNSGWSQCSSQEIARQEKLLTAAWAKASAVMKEQSAASHAALLKEQRAWIVYKDAACQFYLIEADYGREGTVLHFGSCKARIIAGRVADLTAIADQ